jgi:3-hydroxyacyl-CoA dehydrogenase
MEPEGVDTCMALGAGHPMGPLALLDFVGLDVAQAIGDAIGAEVPARIRALVHEGALGKKSGRGFYDYAG